ncbi:MAG TPA: 3-oxoacyl-ACP reductase FabG [Mycobacteriales bacterium]|jgi:3-oxoacyl-[acyl-carrier protein] reductase|nr:3-oxoacyl-ACP reductase FabG [Mycobacteriales bacterium]
MTRSVLVTGASKGIGKAVATTFVAAGDQVAGTYRSGQAADLPPGVLPLHCDVTSAADVEAAFTAAEEAHGRVEVLVSNAGLTRDQLLLRMSDEDLYAVLEANLIGAFRVAKRASSSMLRLRRGRIVLVSSVVALSGNPGQTNYAAAKAGLVGLARSLARELASRGITVNVVAPGPIETEMTGALTDDQRQALVGNVPLARMGAVDEVAAAVQYLASTEAGYVTGAVLPVDGGLGMGH